VVNNEGILQPIHQNHDIPVDDLSFEADDASDQAVILIGRLADHVPTRRSTCIWTRDTMVEPKGWNNGVFLAEHRAVCYCGEIVVDE